MLTSFFRQRVDDCTIVNQLDDGGDVSFSASAPSHNAHNRTISKNSCMLRNEYRLNAFAAKDAGICEDRIGEYTTNALFACSSNR